MKRVLIDYRKLGHQTAALLIDRYPHGYGDDDIITLKKPSGEIIEAVEVKTADTIYLVKISKSLSNFISNFDENLERELENNNHKTSIAQMESNVVNGLNLESDIDNDTDTEEKAY
ncbi:MAG: hypothetical protein AAGB24_12610 [Bacteroidota bacterium]